MPAPRFVHLRMHSEYSVIDGIVRLEDAVQRAVADGMPALALTGLAAAINDGETDRASTLRISRRMRFIGDFRVRCVRFCVRT